MIHVVGLGPGAPDALPPRAFALLTGGLPVLLRTARHPCLEAGPLAEALGACPVGAVTSCDDEYEHGESFSDVYDAIVARILRSHAAKGDLVYAVPGHPLVGETTVARLLSRAKGDGVPLSVVGAPSFVDACLEAVCESVTGNLHVVDALTLDSSLPHPSPSLRGGGPILLYQVHSREAASQAKLALMCAGFPDEHLVTVLRGAGMPNQTKESVPLWELDRRDHDHLTSIWVPPLPESSEPLDFDRVLRIVARLRDPETGCPWDLKQTHASLRKYVLEEAYEVAEAIDEAEPDALCDELGDLLLQVVLNAQIASEVDEFDAGDVCAALADKLLRRHPHIFGDATARTAEEVLANWNEIKRKERGNQVPSSLLDGITSSLPALSQALETSKRVVAVGFEWPELDQVLAKVDEELAELRAELPGGDKNKVADELGDLLFTLVNVARKVGVDPEDALRGQLQKFARRWRHIEASASAQNKNVADLTLAEQEALWSDAKRQEQLG